MAMAVGAAPVRRVVAGSRRGRRRSACADPTRPSSCRWPGPTRS